MILVKDYTVLNLDDLLIGILQEVDWFFGPGLCTSAYRPGDEGVHGTQPVRGYDRRVRDASTGEAIADWVNARWCYDYERSWALCCSYHDTGQGAHLHFQTHPNTKHLKV